MEPCRHGVYRWHAKLHLIFNKELNINQPVARIRIFCDKCNAPCSFVGDDSFSTDRPSFTDEWTTALIPLNYPPIVQIEEKAENKIMKEDKDESEDEDEPQTIH